MAEERNIQVTIAGRTLTLGGSDDAAYMQQVAEYVNGRIREMELSDGYRRLPAEERRLMLLINMADDCLKQKQIAENLQKRVEAMDESIDTLRQELVRARVRNEKDMAKKL